MPRDESTWKLRASTPFIYDSEENVAQKFIHGGRSRVPKPGPGPKTMTTSKIVNKTHGKKDNISCLKSQTFTPAIKKPKPIQTSTFKSKTCNFDAEMAASPVAISHKYYEYITDANAKYNVNGMGAFRKFKPDVPTITCKPQVFDWNLNLQQNILHKPKDSSADLRYNSKRKPISPPPPPTPMPQSSRKEVRKDGSNQNDGINTLDANLSPSTLGLIRQIMRKRSKSNLAFTYKSKGAFDTDSDSTLDGIYVNIPSSSRTKPKNMRKVPQPKSSSTDSKRPSLKRLKSAVKACSNSNNKVFVPRVAMLKKGPSSIKKASTTKRVSTKQNAKSLSTKKTVVKKHTSKDSNNNSTKNVNRNSTKNLNKPVNKNANKDTKKDGQKC